MIFFILNEIEGAGEANVVLDFIRSFPGPCTMTRQAKKPIASRDAMLVLNEILQSLPLLLDGNGSIITDVKITLFKKNFVTNRKNMHPNNAID